MKQKNIESWNNFKIGDNIFLKNAENRDNKIGKICEFININHQFFCNVRLFIKAKIFNKQIEFPFLKNEYLLTDKFESQCLKSELEIKHIEVNNFYSISLNKEEINGIFCRHFYLTRSKTLVPFEFKFDQCILLFSNSKSKFLAPKFEEKFNKKRKFEESCFAIACEKLQLSSIPSQFPCRDSEREKITNFIQNSLSGKSCSGSGLYISGMPGTGKTAIVCQIIHQLNNNLNNSNNKKSRTKNISKFKFVSINALNLPTPEHIYPEIYRKLTGKNVSMKNSSNLLEEYFKETCEDKNLKKRKNKPFCLLLIDELDYLMTRKQNVLYNIFNQQTIESSKLIVIGIANTLDFPESLMSRVRSRIALERVSFLPYDRHQLEQIIRARISELDIFSNDAIELCSRKVASVSGDVRRALQICRRAAEIREQKYFKHDKQNDNLDEVQNSKVQENISNKITLSDISEAVQSINSSPCILMIKSLSLYEKLFLCSIILKLRQVSVEGDILIDFEAVYSRFISACQNNGLDKLNYNQTLDIAIQLDYISLIGLTRLDHMYRNPLIELIVEDDDVCFALKDFHLASNLLRIY